MLFIMLGMLLFSCKEKSELLYSCDPNIDQWVKENLVEIRQMKRDEWNELDERLKKPVFSAFTKNQKQCFWLQKIDEIIELGWNEQELNHWLLAKKEIEKRVGAFDDVQNQNDVDSLEIYFFEWKNIAIKEFFWPKSFIMATLYVGNKVIDKEGTLEIIEKDVKLKTSTENDCECLYGVGCLPYGGTCYKGNCNNVIGCGLLGTSLCDGTCFY